MSMNFNYGIADTTKVKAVRAGHIYSLCNKTVDIENGWFVHKGELMEGQAEIYEAVIPTAASIADTPVVFVAHPAWNYDDCSLTNQNESNYINKSGTSFRAYEIVPGDIVAITDYSADKGSLADFEAGNYVTVQDGTGRIVASSAKPANAFVGKIVGFDQKGYLVPDDAGIVRPFVRKLVIEIIANG